MMRKLFFLTAIIALIVPVGLAQEDCSTAAVIDISSITPLSGITVSAFGDNTGASDDIDESSTYYCAVDIHLEHVYEFTVPAGGLDLQIDACNTAGFSDSKMLLAAPCADGSVMCFFADDYCGFHAGFICWSFPAGTYYIIFGGYDAGEYGAYQIDITECGIPPEVCCDTTINTYPYFEDFEVDEGVWRQSSTEDFDWTRDAGGTATSGTGPEIDHTLGTVDGWYMYTESSSPNNPAKIAMLDGVCFDLTPLAAPQFSFWYHMLGSSMGTLSVEVSDDDCANWTTEWSGTDDLDLWQQAAIDLSAYTGTVAIRFIGLTGSSWYSDMAIDDVYLGESLATPTPLPTATPNMTPGETCDNPFFVDISGFTPYSGGTVSTIGDNTTATENVDESDTYSACSAGDAYNELYYEFIVPAGGLMLQVDTNNSVGMSDSRLLVVAPCADGSTFCEYDDDGGPGFLSQIDCMLYSEGTYYAIVGGFGTSVGEFQLDITECAELPTLVINEIDYDQPVTDDADEFLEIMNVGAVDVDLSLVDIVLINGSGPAEYSRANLTGTLAAGDYYVICNALGTVPNCDNNTIWTSAHSIQNGAPDAAAICLTGTTIIVDTVSYEGDVAGWVETAGAVADDGTIADSSISRCPNGSDTDDNSFDFFFVARSPGLENICIPPTETPIPTATPTPIPMLDCSSAVVVNCGDVVSGDNTGLVNNVDYYNCSTYLESGPEVVYEITISSDINELSASITNTTADLDVFILDACSENSCIAVGDSTASLTGDPVAYGTYFIVIDGYYGAESAFDLTISCFIGDSDLCPGQVMDLTSGSATVVGPMGPANAADDMDAATLSCLTGTNGVDRVYNFTLTDTTNVLITYTNTDYSDTALFNLSSDCNDPAGTEIWCTELTAGYITSEAFCDMAAGTYYIWIDSATASSQYYEISVSTFTPPANDDCLLAAPVTFGSTYVDSGSSCCMTNNYSITCDLGYPADLPEAVYVLTSVCEFDITATLSGFRDNVLYMATDCADIAGTLVGCADVNVGTVSDETLALTNVPAGTYYIFADSSILCGDFTLTIDTLCTPPTPTPVPTSTPADTPTPAPIPTTGPAGLGILLLAISGLLCIGITRRKK